MKTTIGLACAALALGAAIASCSGNGNLASPTSTPTPVPVPTGACTTPPGEQIQVVYPPLNAVNVSTGNIIIAVAPNPLPSTANLYVQVYNVSSAGGPVPMPTGTPIGAPTGAPLLNTPTYGTPLQTIPIAQLPSGSLVPPFPFPIYQQSNFGGLFGAGLFFQIYLGASTCSPGISLSSSFST
jgi:hypothetical protein